MKFAARVYVIAGIIGLIEIVPLYFSESLIGSSSPTAITHPEFYYGFAGVTLAWQILFVLLARDPLRYRPLMVPAILEKAAFVFVMLVLMFQQRVSTSMLGFVIVDASLGMLFLLAYRRTGRVSTEADTRTAAPPMLG